MRGKGGGQGVGWGAPHSMIFFDHPPIKTNASCHGVPHLKNEAPLN